jgi:hypothetical protein
MGSSAADGWHNAYLRAKQIESELGLPQGSVKPEVTGKFSLIFIHCSEEQIRQMAHLWYVLTQTTHIVEQDSGVHHKKGDAAS